MRVTAAAGRLTEQPLFRFLRFLCYINADIWNYQLIWPSRYSPWMTFTLTTQNIM